MVLADTFYYQPVQIDTINTRVFADLIAKEGDTNGRGLLVTLTENGLVKNTTGIALNLKWEHVSVGNQGLDNFEAVDLRKGLYKITYPTEMLNRGKVRAFIQIIDSGKLASSRNIEITVDRGVGDDAAIVSSNSFTALAKALIGVTNIEQQLAEAKADLQAGIGAVTADAEVVTARASSIKGKTFGVIDARFEAIEFDTVLMATNKVVNGEFSGVSGWSSLYASLSASSNVLSITGYGTNATPRAHQITTGKITANTKIYASQIVKVTNAVCSNITIELKSDPTLSAFGVFGSVTSPAQNVAYRVSGIVQAPSGYDNNNIVLFARNTYADGATASGKVLQLSVPIVLNLTEIFGVGNEPNSTQMDRLLTQFPNSWFTGTENLFLAKWALNELRRLDNDKANKAQGAWITPTLVNGATGTFQYRKNEFGRLEFKGELTQASTASYFAITIAGYRPPAWVRCPITSIDGVVSMLIMSDGGALYLHTPLAGKTISFSGISINIQ